MMKLNEFVTETLCEIAKGIKQAQEKNEYGGKLAVGKSSAVFGEPQCLSSVHFDVVLQSESTAEGDTGFSVSFGGATLEKDGNATSLKEQACTHISFDVPVIWPTAQ